MRYDQMEGDRFRHTVQLERWRPDRDPRSCTFEQLEVPHAYDLGAVLRVTAVIGGVVLGPGRPRSACR